MNEDLNKVDLDQPSAFVSMMEQVIPEPVRRRFAEYVKSFNCSTWHILSDYCIGNDGYPNDVLVFTTLPEHDHELFLKAVKGSLPADLKKRSMIPNESIGFLNHVSLFTFAFAIDKKPRFLSTVEFARKVIDEHIENLSDDSNAKTPTNQALIKKMKRMREEARSRSFNLSMFNRIYMAVVFASFITLMLARNTNLEIIHWIGDRDNIHSNWDNLCYALFHGLSFTFMNDEQFPLVRCRFPASDADFETTFDPYTRIPDHFAGPLAHLDLTSRVIRAKSPKYERILKEVIAGNPRFNFAAISFKPDTRWLTNFEFREGSPPG